VEKLFLFYFCHSANKIKILVDESLGNSDSITGHRGHNLEENARWKRRSCRNASTPLVWMLNEQLLIEHLSLTYLIYTTLIYVWDLA